MPNRMHLTRRAMLGSSMLSLAVPAFAATMPSWRDAAAPTAARVSDLLARMTLEEKAAQLRCMWNRKAEFLDKHGAFSEERATIAFADGIGQIARPSDLAGLPVRNLKPYRSFEDTVNLVNAIQHHLVTKTRLGIPAMFHDELAHGLLANDATIFPTPIALGCSWDTDLIEQVFTIAASEARPRGTNLALTPVVDLLRDPRYGRSEEFFGEDPHHVAQMGIAAVRGLQGRERPLGRDRVFATLKHFVHAVPQGGLNTAPADISERSLRENFLVPFEQVIRHADPAVIMPSYNEIEGVPSHANVELLQATGRRRLGCKGAYFSDYEGVGNLKDQHHVAATKDDAAVLAINAGVGADLPEGKSFAHLPDLVRAGRISAAQLDAAVAHVLALKFEAGLFENPYLDLARVRAATNTPANIALARTAAEKSIVLLKNDGTVPLAPNPGMRLAVIGPNAAEPLLGGYSGANDKAVGMLEGIRKAAPAGMVVEHADGVWIMPPDPWGEHRTFSPTAPVPEADDAKRIAEATDLAKRSDMVLLVLGEVPSISREAVDYALPGDRATLGLWGRQDALVEAMVATGKPLVVLLINGRPLAIPRLAEAANALFEGWYLGQEGGHAFADILFGKANPGGKLSVSFPRSVGELPVFYNRHPSADSNHYVESEHKTVFPFGHGLSYTSFEIGTPSLARSTIGITDTAEVSIDVTNTGHRAGDEVVQVYIRDEVSSVPRPVLELKAFRRVTLQPGETRKLTFRLEPDDLAFWDIAMNWTVEPGDFTIFAGPSSAQLKSTHLTVSGPKANA